MHHKIAEMDHQYQEIQDTVSKRDLKTDSNVKALKKDLANSEKEKKSVESRIKDLNEVIQRKNTDLKQYQQTIEAIEGLQKKAKTENDKTKREKEEFKKQRDYLKLQNEEFSQQIQKFQKEAELLKKELKQTEKMKNEAIKKLQENQKMWEEIEQNIEDEAKSKRDDLDVSAERHSESSE